MNDWECEWTENRTTRKKDDISNGQNTINEYTHPNSTRYVLTTPKMMNENRTLLVKPNKLGKTMLYST